MNLASPSQIKAWCQANGFHPNKVLGQNFLIDRNALDAILDAANLTPGERVLEVGPGLGALTEGLLERGCTVVAVEKDSVLADHLTDALDHPEALTVIKGDALDLAKRGALDGIPTMVSNLPYQAGTRILLELIKRLDAALASAADASRVRQDEPPSKIVILVQTEVAERLAAGPGSKTRGLAGVWAQLDYDVSIVRPVSAGCFWPRPEVGSSVVKLVRHHRNDALAPTERELFRRLTKQAFEHRRKQLGSIFKGYIQSTARAEELENEDWTELVKGLCNEDT